MVVSSDESDILKILEIEMDKLLEHCRHLQEEVARLRTREQSWNKERAHLLERQATVRIRMAAMVSRLKFLERL